MLIAASGAMACTNFIVGKKASKDGSVICSYSADSYGMFTGLRHQPAAKHQKGDMRKIYEWDTNKYLGEIPEAAETYNTIGNINEWQVTIGETTFGGREEMVDTTGIIDYGSLIYIALQRTKTAREAISIMTTLVEQYGYCSEGETFTICDPNEAWIMEMMGAHMPDSVKATLKPSARKQLGRTVWVALRIPDDMICGHANQSRITTFNMKDKSGDVLYSKNVVTYARQMGWFTGKDEAFSYNAAYAKPDFTGRRICDARVWSFFNRYADGMDRYLPWADGHAADAEVMPLWVKPSRLLTVADVEAAMRDHFEGTPFSLDQSYFRAQKEVEDRALAMDEKARVKYLTGYTSDKATQMLDRWKRLATYLIVKYNDMIAKPEENGQFTRTPYGFGSTVKRPGYPTRYASDLVKQTGDKFLLPADK